MPFVPAVNVVQVTLEQTYSSQPVANVINLAFPAAPTLTSIQDALAGIQDWADTEYAPLMHLGWSLNVLRGRDLTTQSGIVVERPVSGIIGQLAGTPLPGNNAMCLSLRTIYAGRSQRGRFYVTALTSALLEATNANLFTAGAITARITALSALRTALATAQTPWAVVSKFSNNAPRVTAQINPVTSIISTDPTVDSQRGRTRS